ncbi:MAG: uroporphyrinogen decarboxylase family protein [Candidatus Hodarchaeota archaeon]
MNSRKRVLATLNREVPDRVPIDMGGNQSSIHIVAYKRLLDHLGIHDDNIRYNDIIQHIAFPCEELLERFEIDTRFIRPPGSLLAEDHELETEKGWIGLYDALGVFWGYNSETPVEDIRYLDPVIHPLKECKNINDIREYDWPDGKDKKPLAGLKEFAKTMREKTDFALVTPVIGCVFEYCTFMFGFTKALRFLRTKPEIIVATMEELLKYWMDYSMTFLDEVGDNVDVVCINGDLAEQAGPIMNPNSYEKVIKPIEMKLSKRIHEKLDVKINYHCCGSTPLLLDHFADIGYDAYNPVQISAYDMNPCSLKKRFGSRISFWGGACNTQATLPFGTPKQIREEVKYNMNCLKKGGGYVASNIHNITAEVPPENIVAMFDAIREFRDY